MVDSSGDQCAPSEHEPCDEGSTDLAAALGLGCPGGAEAAVTVEGSPAALGVRSGFGPTAEWAPREGSMFAVLGTGLVTDLDLETPDGDLDMAPTHCNDDLGAQYDPGMSLPAPLQPNAVRGDCSRDAALLGTGDCSGTMEGPFSLSGNANDYTELRIVADVPASNTSLHYDFAFFSTEYPFYYGSQFSDMHIAWLESERWTGNISFDDEGYAIWLDTVYLELRDDGGSLPELDGTCMKQHAGTRWLQSVAPVTPGETITLVLAVFDMADSILDSYVFLDNFGWGCDGTDTPTTNPVG